MIKIFYNNKHFSYDTAHQFIFFSSAFPFCRKITIPLIYLFLGQSIPSSVKSIFCRIVKGLFILIKTRFSPVNLLQTKTFYVFFMIIFLSSIHLPFVILLFHYFIYILIISLRHYLMIFSSFSMS